MNIRSLVGVAAAGLLSFAVGCGGSTRHVDTGAGANQSVPATENCADLCQRLGDCVEVLCNEDTKSTRFTGLGGLLVSQCEATCTDDLVHSTVNSTQWTCTFMSSCREVLDYDDCGIDGSYHCQ
jgi:hypothetical protein